MEYIGIHGMLQSNGHYFFDTPSVHGADPETTTVLLQSAVGCPTPSVARAAAVRRRRPSTCRRTSSPAWTSPSVGRGARTRSGVAVYGAGWCGRRWWRTGWRTAGSLGAGLSMDVDHDLCVRVNMLGWLLGGVRG